MIHGLQESITHAIALEAKVFWETNSAAAATATTAADVFNRFLKPFQQPKTIQLLDSSDEKVSHCNLLLNTYLGFLTYWAKDRLALTGFKKKQGLGPTVDLRDVFWKLVAHKCFKNQKTFLQRFAQDIHYLSYFERKTQEKSPFSRTNKALYHKHTSKYKSVGVILLPLMNSKTIWQ